MSRDKGKQDARDRNRVAGGQDCGVEFIAREHDISKAEARRLIKEHGHDRTKLLAAVLASGTAVKLFLAPVFEAGLL